MVQCSVRLMQNKLLMLLANIIMLLSANYLLFLFMWILYRNARRIFTTPMALIMPLNMIFYSCEVSLIAIFIFVTLA